MQHKQGWDVVNCYDEWSGGVSNQDREVKREVPDNNDFLLDSQFWVAGELNLRRPDLAGFVNGLPLVMVELKKPGVNVSEGFEKNSTTANRGVQGSASEAEDGDADARMADETQDTGGGAGRDREDAG